MEKLIHLVYSIYFMLTPSLPRIACILYIVFLCFLVEKKGSNVSVVCVQNETNTCSATFEIETFACPNDGEAYRIETSVTRSVFCLGEILISVLIWV